MDSSAPPTPCAHDHALRLYDEEEGLADSVGGYLAAGLLAGEGALVIVTGEHRQTLAATLTRRDIDVEYAVRADRLLMVDAAETLRTLMTPTGPDVGRCAVAVGSLLDRTGRGGRAVRFYGDMLALLWRDGDVTSAMALEQLGTGMAAERGCSLWCGYPRSLFAEPQAAADLERLSALHTRVLPPDDPEAGGAGRPRHLAAVSPLRTQTAPPAARPAGRRRSLGLCAHCGEPVAHDEAYVRLHRRAWHLECALESHGSAGERPGGPDP